MVAYATVAELAEHIKPEPVPASAARLLVRSSRRVDEALLCSVYPVDEVGRPTTAAHIIALREATLEQAAGCLDNGDDEGLSGPVISAKIGSVQLSRGGGGADPASAGGLYAEAERVLVSAGLTGQAPRTYP